MSLLPQDQLQQKIICPGPVTCLAASPNGLYVLAGVAESIYLWEVRGMRGTGARGPSALPRHPGRPPRHLSALLPAGLQREPPGHPEPALPGPHLPLLHR